MKQPVRNLTTVGPLGRRLAVLALVAGLVAAAGTAHAQGFGIFEHGTCAMGRAGAAVAQSCDDASGVFFNPSHLAGTQGLTASGGATVIMVGGDFTPDDGGPVNELQNDPIVVPHVYVSYGLTERLAAGLGLYVPYGLGTVWPEDPDDGFEGRFMGYDNSLQTIYVQPTLAFQVTDRIALGAGLVYANGSVQLNQRLDLAERSAFGIPLTALGIMPGTDFADAQLEASNATGFGGNFGLQVEVTDRVRLGARYMLPIQLEYEGDATFGQVSLPDQITLPAGNPFGLPAGTPLTAIVGGPGVPLPLPPGVSLDTALRVAVADNFSATLAPQSVTTEIEMPAQLVVGGSVDATPELTLLLDYQWTNWASFDEIVLDFETAPNSVRIENYEDTHAFRLGAEYRLTDQWRARLGFLRHNAAAPPETVTPLLPEADRTEITVGLGWNPTGQVGLNAAYQYINQADRDGRVREPVQPGAVPTTALNSGTYSFGAHLVGLTLTVRL